MSRSRGFEESFRPRSFPEELPERPASSASSASDVDEDFQPYTTRNHTKVERVLNQWHIFLITISGVIGMGLFDNSGEILRIAGPLGGITAFLIVGLFVIFIMEGIAEMVGHWPIANCMFEFVAKFVDKDLAIVVGIAYWYCYAIGYATLIVAAANLASFWHWSETIQDLLFTVGVMALLICINCMGVLSYAYVESVLGLMKILLVVGAFLTMVGINLKDTGANTPNGRIGSTNIDNRYQHDPNVAENNFIAVLVVIPIVAYAYCGVEIVAVTALEAKDQHSLKFPAKWIAYLTTAAYVLSVIGFYLNVSWLDSALPIMEGRKNETIALGLLNSTLPTVNSTGRKSTTLVIIATLESKIPALPSILNVGLIFAVLSTSNTSLYVASRTLYGLTKGVNPNTPYWGWMSRFSRTTPKRKVPALALLFSAFSFCWVPFLRFSKSLTNQELQEIMSGIATVGVVIVWAAQCLAFIRYRWWLKKHEGELKGRYSEYDYWTIKNDTVPFRTLLGGFQPFPAWVGLISCILIIFVFATSSWWNDKENGDAVAAALAGPSILFVVWCTLKFFRRRRGDTEWWVKLGNWDELQRTLNLLAASRDPDRNDQTGRPVQEVHPMVSRSLHTHNFRNAPQRFGRNLFTLIPGPPEPVHKSAYVEDESVDVSPATRPTQHALGIHDMDPFELPRSSEGSIAGQRRFSDTYRKSISDTSSPRRKPVPSTYTASISAHSDRELGKSSEHLISSRESSTTQQAGSRSLSLGDHYTYPVPPRRSGNTLVPPERNHSGGSRAVDERDLHPQDKTTGVVWGQLTPQSPSPATLSPQWQRQACSEPDTGVQSQMRVGLQRAKGRFGERDDRAPEAVMRDRLQPRVVDEGDE